MLIDDAGTSRDRGQSRRGEPGPPRGPIVATPLSVRTGTIVISSTVVGWQGPQSLCHYKRLQPWIHSSVVSPVRSLNQPNSSPVGGRGRASTKATKRTQLVFWKKYIDCMGPCLGANVFEPCDETNSVGILGKIRGLVVRYPHLVRAMWQSDETNPNGALCKIYGLFQFARSVLPVGENEKSNPLAVSDPLCDRCDRSISPHRDDR